MLHDFSKNAKSTIFTCGDSKSPSYIIQNEPIKKMFFDCVKKGIKYNYITEITEENIPYCKEILQIIGPDELRHLDKIKGNFALTESEYLASCILLDEQPLAQLIYSNVKEIVEQQKYL
ncbi:MAG: hypothetical protein H0X03_09655 [Nitrosopumilus sp.]|nr:hypothetical protein [Nitrosopumilus sp.]